MCYICVIFIIEVCRITRDFVMTVMKQFYLQSSTLGLNVKSSV